MRGFLEKFFRYYQYPNDEGILGLPEPFQDGLGQGAFSDWRHFAWMGITILLSVLLYQVFKRNKDVGRKTMIVLVIIMFMIRLINQSVRAGIGAEDPAFRAFPFHLCTVMTFVLPIIVVFNMRSLKTAVYTLSMMGGIITIIIGDYFDDGFMTFSTIEGMWAHTVLILIPIIDIAIGGFKLEFKKSWTVIVGMVILLIWATIANEIFFKNYDTNYMYLKKNGLPGNIGGDLYFLIYVVIFFILFAVIYAVPSVYRKYRKIGG